MSSTGGRDLRRQRSIVLLGAGLLLASAPAAAETAGGDARDRAARTAMARLVRMAERAPRRGFTTDARGRMLRAVRTSSRALSAGRVCRALRRVDPLRQLLADRATWRSDPAPPSAAALDRFVVRAERALLATGRARGCVARSRHTRVKVSEPKGPFPPVQAPPAEHEQGGPEHPPRGANPSHQPHIRRRTRPDVPRVDGTESPQGLVAFASGSGDRFRLLGRSDLGIPPVRGFPMEPQAASAKGVVFYSGNNDAAYSLDDGNNWTYTHPDAMFGTVDGGYVGDSQVRYAPQIDSFIWLMQYGCKGGDRGCTLAGAANRYRLAVATPAAIRANTGAPGRAWTVWSLQSVATFKSRGWFDFPDLALGDRKLYLTWNELTPGRDGVINARVSLKELQAGGTIGIDYWRSSASIFWRLAQDSGPRGFYISNGVAADKKTDLGRAVSYTWDDASGLIFPHDLHHDALPSGPYKYTDPAGETTWCRACDVRPESATIRGNELWVAWTAAGDKTFPQPHIQIEIFNASTYALLRHDIVANPGFAIALPALRVNSERDVGLAFTYGGATQNPSPAAGWLTPRRDFFSPAQGEIVSGAGQGDYASLNPDFPDASRFTTAGYISRLEGGAATNHWWFMRFGHGP